jgi:hypothetical protein
MYSVRNLMQRHSALMIAVLAMTFVIVALGGEAFAAPSAACIAGGGDPAITTPCTINSAVTSCPYVLALPAEDLLITSTGSIKCDGPGALSASPIDITVGGKMEMQAGSEITAENTSGAGNGADITITVSGDFIMRGPGAAGPATDLKCADVEGACISSSNNNGSGTAGNIKITVGDFPNTPAVGLFTMEPGSAVLANSTGSGGAIEILAGLQMDVDGLVRSFGGTSGVTPQRPGGGPITLKSGCQLIITPDGVVSSEGQDPGADLVHLEGCEVTINGLVQSIVVPGTNGGHALPTTPANHCNLDTVTHPAVNKFTACVEVWANNITINSISPNKGQVNADGVTDNTANDTRAWIDLFAKNNITINNDNVGPYPCTPTPGDGGFRRADHDQGGAGQVRELGVRGAGRRGGPERPRWHRDHRGRGERGAERVDRAGAGRGVGDQPHGRLDLRALVQRVRPGQCAGPAERQRVGAGHRGNHAAGLRDHGGGGRRRELHGHDATAGDDSGGCVRRAGDGVGGVPGGLAGARRYL